MTQTKVKALFLDIDGTLIGLKSHQMNPTDIESLKSLKERGLMLFIASGRDFYIPDEIEVIRPIFPYLSGYIDLNGQHSALMDGTEIYSIPIADEDFLPLRQSCEEHHFSMLYRHDNLGCVTELTDRVIRYAQWMGMEVPTQRPMDPDIHNIPKLCIYCSPEEEREFLSPLMNHTWSARITSDLIDLIPNGVGKETGIRRICAQFGIDLTETMAFGDGQNDLGMMDVVGTAVAMENAAPNVKAAADHVTSATEEAGITLALRHFGLL